MNLSEEINRIKVLMEQPMIFGMPGSKSSEEFQKGMADFYKENPHLINAIMGLTLAFVPPIGPYIASMIGLMDAYQYYKEGDNKTAGLVTLFSVLPGIGPVVAKIPGIKQLGQYGMKELAKKIGTRAALNNVEAQVVTKMAQNRQLIQAEMKKLGEKATINAAKQKAKSQIKKGVAKNVLKTGTKEIGKLAAITTGYNKTYDYIKRDTPKVMTSKENLNWEFVKSQFGSSGSKEDNFLLKKAWKAGWRPGKEIPKEYQTNLYKTQNSELPNDEFLKQMRQRKIKYTDEDV